VSSQSPTQRPADELIALVDDAGPGSEAAAPGPQAWNVLVIDDEREVHQATTFALSGFRVAGRPLNFIHAYSAREGRELLAAQPDVAVVLLDVVMETEDAGLKLVRVIRDELGRRATRIVLRTGQPGYAPELEVIQQYDINDYKTKSELTRTRLATTITSAIRSYDQICTVEASRAGLSRIVSAAADLFGCHGTPDFSAGVLLQLARLIGQPADGLVCAGGDAKGAHASEYAIMGAAGRYSPHVGRVIADLGDARVEAALRRALAARSLVVEPDHIVFALRSHAGRDVVVLAETHEALDATQRQLVEVFASNVAVGFENVSLFERLTDFAYVDQLSRLPNRNRFVALIDDQVKIRREGYIAGILDLDNFSETNDALGHEVGDQLLGAVGARLRAALPDAVVVARVSGDSYGLFGPEPALDPARILGLFADPVAVSQYQLHLSATLGLARLEDCDGAGADALKNASLALKRAKARERGRAFYYRREIEIETRERVRLAHALRRSIDGQELMLYYQPQLDLRDGRTVGVEALLRWKAADGRFVPPDKFIPVAEQSGLIRPIGDWALRTACRQLKDWEAAGLTGLRVAVNVSLEQFRDDRFADKVGEVVAQQGIDPRLLELEITESMAMDEVDIVMATLERLSRIGVGVAIDDFGTGFSSLGYLQQLAVDRLKIDRRFVNELDAATGRASIAETIVKLGHNLGLEIIAEGVETESQAARLREMGCELAQGFLYQRPVDAKALLAWMREPRTPPAPQAPK